MMRRQSVEFLMVSRSTEHLSYFCSYHMKYRLSQSPFPTGRFKILKFLKCSYALQLSGDLFNTYDVICELCYPPSTSPQPSKPNKAASNIV